MAHTELTDTEKLENLLAWLRKDLLPRISREFENHLAQPFILSYASKELAKYGSPEVVPPIGLADKVASIMAMDMDSAEKERLLASVIAKESE